MYSLLSEEIMNYKKIEKVIIEKNIEENIENKNIIKKIITENELDEEKSLNTNFFNPLKNSPPNNWQNRLFLRINSLNDLEKIKS